MTFSHLISHAFLINLRINSSKKIFLNIKIKEIKIVIISPKARYKPLKAQSKSNTHINRKKE